MDLPTQPVGAAARTLWSVVPGTNRLPPLALSAVAEGRRARDRAGAWVGDRVRAVVRRAVALVLEQVDVDAIVGRVDVDAIVGRVDVDAIVGRLDLAALAREVIDAVDLPEIIRQSSGTMASETVRGVRLQSIDADERVNRIVDRLLLRAGRRGTAPDAPDADGSAPTQAGP